MLFEGHNFCRYEERRIIVIAGMWQVLLSIFRFGELSWLFSDVGMSGYTAGAGIHLFTSQIKSLLGLKMPRRIGPFVVLWVNKHCAIILCMDG